MRGIRRNYREKFRVISSECSESAQKSNKQAAIAIGDCDLFFCAGAVCFVHHPLGGGRLTVYLDVTLVLNFAVNYLLLRATARLGGAALRARRLLPAAGVGALYAVAVFLPRCGWLTAAPCKLAVAAGMLVIAFGARKPTLRLGAVFAGLSLALCGAVYGVMLLRGESPRSFRSSLFYPVSFATLLLTAFAVSAATRLLLPKLTHAADSVVPLTLLLDGRSAAISALRDTGNTLRDPISGEAVLVAQWTAARRLLPAYHLAQADFEAPAALAVRLKAYAPRLIPFRAVGTHAGLLLAVPCEVRMPNGKQRRCLTAFSAVPLGDGGAYDALIGGNVNVEATV